MISKIKKHFRKSKAQIYYKNFFQADLSDADYVFCYLFPNAMQKLKEKFDQELKPGAKVLAYGFQINDWIQPQVYDIELKKRSGHFYVYEV